jgi:hypothetical protein
MMDESSISINHISHLTSSVIRMNDGIKPRSLVRTVMASGMAYGS